MCALQGSCAWWMVLAVCWLPVPALIMRLQLLNLQAVCVCVSVCVAHWVCWDVCACVFGRVLVSVVDDVGGLVASVSSPSPPAPQSLYVLVSVVDDVGGFVASVSSPSTSSSSVTSVYVNW